ncbi:MFS transporter [Microcoleus sp. FACHB-831]|uniref:MFS transporter n=1 Tax=Microcoleus sp. FACHB-831 TaxID=2692827 RepID=UPI0016868723|nr:MFS transporter [Microcoleus sp. FACHB-831]MBD1921934.1 MFS transporter [Microcoleus sp. FACHB-831]
MTNNVPSDHSDVTPESEKLNFSTKVAYGVGDMGPAMTANMLIFYLSPFLTDVAGLNPQLAGKTQLVGKVWDAVNDPLVGVLSDKTKSRWGRRYPWMILGGIPFGIFFFLQWINPFSGNQWGMFWYYTIISILFNSFYTVVNVPYTALTPELTQDYNERTRLNSFRFTFSIGGSILSVIIFGIIQSLPVFRNNPSQQYLVMGIVITIISVLPLYWCVWGTKARVAEVSAQHPETEQPVSAPLLQQLKDVLRNRPFLYVVGIYLCSWLSVQLTAAIIPYFVRNCMGLGDPSAVVFVILAVQVTAIAMLPVWNRLSQKRGKKGVYFMGMSLWIIAQAGLFFLPSDQVALMYVLAVMAGFGVSIAYLIPWSMLPDVIELDELRTGQRREGIFYSFITFVQKVCLGIAVDLALSSLAWAGYVKPTGDIPLPRQDEAVIWVIRLFIGPVPTVALICGLVLAYFYPLTREVHAEILLKLKERRSREA